MNNLFKFVKGKGYDRKLRTHKLTASALGLALDYFTTHRVDLEFCKEARSSLRTIGPDNKVYVSKKVHDKVMQGLPTQRAIDTCLLAQPRK